MFFLIHQFVNSLNKLKTWLLVFSLVLVFSLIILSNLGVLPLKNGDFTFFMLVSFALALYRPGWAFLFFISVLGLENIQIAPESFPLNLRPYQILAFFIALSIAIRYFLGRLNFKLPKFHWFDCVIILIPISSFVSALASAEKLASLKLSLVLASFVLIYFLVRIFIQDFSDLKRVLPFFLGSSIIIVFYGIWQNVAFVKGWPSFETMPGRPNATFTEPDWLGIYVALLIAVLYSIVYYINKAKIKIESPQIFNSQFSIFNQFSIPKFKNLKIFFIYLYLIAAYILLVLTVSRSAWLGAVVITILFLKLILTNAKFNPQSWQWKEFLVSLQYLTIVVFCSVGIVYIFHLTNFQLFNRVQSSASGLQKITIACEKEISLPENINDIQELEQYNCKHINLEDIEKEKSAGNIVAEIYRKDPNVNIRKVIYTKSIAEIKKNPIFGIGWGSIGQVLGKDENGTPFNASNIFLEIWLGSGALGLLAFLVILIYIFIQSIRKLLQNNLEYKIIGIFSILGLFSLFVPNMFNAGIFLGILWLYLGITISLISKRHS